MTFYEAAVQILTREGRPLHAREIAEIALRENLLSHVGKQPELTMASRLAAMARRSHDRRLVAVEADTFGLVDWSLAVAPEALEASGLREVHDETEPPLRGRERHPRISKENVRVAGRSERRRREEGERKKKRLPPVAQVVYELLERVGRPVALFDLVATARERELFAAEVGSEAVKTVLLAENERREADGRKPVFEFHDGGFVGIRGRHGAPEEGVDVLPILAAAGRDLALERIAPKPAPAAAPASAPVRGPLTQALAEARQRAVKQLRRRLCELDNAGIETIASLAAEAMGYRDIRVAKRGKEGALFVAKRRMGIVELRFCIRAIRAGRDLRREDVLDLRRELAAHGAQLGVLLSPADASREARSEAAQTNAPVVLLLCADALADQLAEKGIGVSTRTVTVVEFDENAFRALRREERPAEERGGERKDRDEARREREERRRAREERRVARAATRATQAGAAGGEMVVTEGTIVAGTAIEGLSVEAPAVQGMLVEVRDEPVGPPVTEPSARVGGAVVPEAPVTGESPAPPPVEAVEPAVPARPRSWSPPAGPVEPFVTTAPTAAPEPERESRRPEEAIAAPERAPVVPERSGAPGEPPSEDEPGH